MIVSYEKFYNRELYRRYESFDRPRWSNYSYIVPQILEYVRTSPFTNTCIIGAGGVGTNIGLSLYEINAFYYQFHTSYKFSVDFVDGDEYEYHNIFRIRDLPPLLKSEVKRQFRNLSSLNKAYVMSSLTNGMITAKYCDEDVINNLIELEYDVIIECASRRTENLVIEHIDINSDTPVISISTDGKHRISIRRLRKTDNTPIADGYVKIDSYDFIMNTVAAAYTLPILFNLLREYEDLIIDLNENHITKIYLMNYSEYVKYIKSVLEVR